MKKIVFSIALLLLTAVSIVNAGTITITSPNGGEVWAGCTSKNITWTSSGVSNNYSIDYSTDGGSTWVSVTSALYISSGTYAWTVPNINSTSCKLRVTDSSNPTYTDMSDNTFSITAPLILTSPNGSESWQAGASKSITWLANGTSNYFDLFYSTNAGGSWTSIYNNYNTTSGTYSWSVPNTPSAQCLVKVQDHTNTTCMVDVSDNLFTLAPPTPVITVTSPNTAVTWLVGTAYNVTWTAQNTGTDLFKIEYTTNNGTSWVPIITSILGTTGTYSWTVPATTSNQCKVKVTDLSVPTTKDSSDVVFTIANPVQSVTVTYPNTNTTLYSGNTYNITWSSANIGTDPVKIDFSTNNGASWTNIVASTTNSGSYGWLVPNTPSALCLVKVSDALNLAIKDSSDAPFIINTPSITITSPNGGNNLIGCSTASVTWVSLGCSNNYNVDYSIDGGTTWISVASSIYITNGTYTWTVPSVYNSNYKLRIMDASNTSVYDMSDNTFTVSPAIIITSPNGGETWQAGSSKTINWASASGSTQFLIYYSTNNGSTWTQIGTTYYTGNSLAWTVPNLPSSSCLIKIIDNSLACKYDVSDAVFSITPPTPTITVNTPNTATTLYVGATYSISWTDQYITSGFIKLEYSTNNGVSWLPIVNPTNDGGSYSWTVPNTPSSQCLVRASDYNNPSTTYDVSNTTFTIAYPYITLTYPNGGETFTGCGSQTISWTAGGTSGTYVVQYSLDSGYTYTTLTSSVSSTSYTWSAVTNASSTAAYIRVYDYSNSSLRDSNNLKYTMVPNNEIIITSPNGGETWQAATSKTITWANAPTSTTWYLYYSTNGGANYSQIGSYTSTNSQTWTVPNSPSTNCLIKVVDYSNSCKFDVSNAPFTITAPAPVITVTSPNTAVTWYVGATNTISWSSQYVTSPYVRIEYTTNNGTSWNDVISTTQNNGSYSWVVPATPSSQCKIRVSEFGNASNYDISDVNFTIANPFINVTTPNGGENWYGCSSQYIYWTSGGTSTYYKVQYSTDNGITYNTLTSSTSSTSYNWNPVVSVGSSNCWIKVSDAGNTSIKDSNNLAFTLTPNTDILVTSPNGGETWQAGTTKTITWATAPTSVRWYVYYSIDNGSSWTVIGSSYTTPSVTWTVPNSPSANCLIKVVDYSNSCIMDVSNTVFSITAPTPVITVTAPNTATTLYVGSSNTISWSTAYLTTSYVKIDYSTDGGSTWTNIAPVATNSGSYTWPTPATPSTQCRVRVSDYNNASTYDISDINFTIAYPSITVTYPNGGEIIKGCSSKTITWTGAGVSGYYNIQYSLNNGASWTNITTYVSTTSYTWSTVVNSPSANCLIRVLDYNNNSIKDSSNAVFTIQKNADIFVLQPNGGQNWLVNSSNSITWVSEPTTTRYIVYYSADNGSTWNTVISSTYASPQTWTAPSTVSNQYLVKVVDYYNTCIYDVSDTTFSVSNPPPYITVTYPNTATTLYVGNSATIQWNYGFLSSSFVSIDYTTDNGATWISISPITQNTGSYSWTIPATPSANCRVRVSEYNNPSVSDQSDVVFPILYPYIVVTSPNTAESIKGCSSKTVTWNAFGTSGYYKVQYSTNNGASWTNLTSSYTTSTSYTWSPVANSPSNTCLIKILDYNNTNIKDSSDVPFTIVKNVDITITSPNGNENWIVGTSYNTTWVSEPTTTRYSVYYSTTSGASWNSLYSGTYSMSYSWSIPNSPSTLCRYKVEDYYNTCIFDVSDTNFTIATPPPYITITYPNTATTLYVGSSATIQWSYGYLTSSFVAIDYTLNNGASWIPITAITQNNGSYAWTIPAGVSTQCKIRVSEYGNPVMFDLSDVSFTIANPYILVSTPNGGQSYESCKSTTVSWSSNGTTGYYAVYYSINGGASWTTLTSSTSSTSYSWTPNVSSVYTNCLIKVASTANTTICDSSDTYFTLLPNDDIIVTSPNGSENWQAGSVQTLTWVSAPTTSYFYVYYTTDGGSTWNMIGSSYYSSNSLSWTVPNTPSSICKIKVVDYNNSCIYDMSNNYFTITPGSAKVTAPNGGESLYYGSTYSITWTSAYYYGTYVSINYSLDSGLTWQPIVSVTNNTGSYSWSVPATFSNKCLVKINDYSTPSVYDVSDAIFSINPGLIVTSPNGDNGMEEWRVCTQTTIKWTSGGGSGYYKLEYSTNNGGTWSTIVSSVSSAGSNNTYNWTIPNTPSTQCLVRVTDTSYPLKTDVSDATFTIKPAITITSPNGGESLSPSSSYNVTWTSYGSSNYYDIDYSINGGTSWTNVGFNQYITTNTFSWLVPTASSANCLVKLTDHINTCKIDQSDNTFSIGMPTPIISVTSPNGGNTFTGCNTTNITWTATNTSGAYTLEYSKDNGLTWTNIISNYLSLTYSWTIPNVSSSSCLVRVKDYNNPSINDVSNATFTINAAVTATVTPTGNTTFCSGNSVILTSSSTTGNIWSPGGQTTQSITVSTQGVYYVSVNQSGCTATSASITVTVNPIPSAPVATSNSPVALNGTINLVASTIAGATYAWTGPNSFTSNSQNPSITLATLAMGGTYGVRATVNGCQSAQGTVIVTVTSTPASAIISGRVLSQLGSAISGVKVKVTGSTSDSITTANDGVYSFTLVQGNSYTITPSKSNDVNITNGITTLDIALINKHILNTSPLNSPYKIISGDVNSSSNLTNLDIAYIKALILGNITNFPSGKFWAFANSSYTFSDPYNPFPYENSRSYSSATTSIDQNFVGMKLGDVNNSWDPIIAKSTVVGNLKFVVPSITAHPNDEIIIPISVKDFQNVSGYQFTFQWDANLLQYEGVDNGSLEPNVGTNFVSEGKLTMLWVTDNLQGITLADGSVVFGLKFKIIGTSGNNAAIEINSAYTNSIAYNSSLEELDVLTDNGVVEISDIISGIEDNSSKIHFNCNPNPFSDNTEITFLLPGTEKVDITIYDMIGKVIQTYVNTYCMGIHKIIWDGKDNTGNRIPSGSYFIRLKVGNSQTTQKLIYLNN